MIRWVPLLKGPELLADNRAAAEFEAMKRHGDTLYRCVSRIELDLEQDEVRSLRRTRGPPGA